tara:strand:- start:37 stop:600 length:564 start_codon:yes stop_codon:yes gene_type:complete
MKITIKNILFLSLILMVIISFLCLVLFFYPQIPNDFKSEISENKKVILIDFRRPSFLKRLWVVENNEILLSCHVSHGINSGDIYADNFSNIIGSYKSSLGEFITAEVYYRDNSKRMRIDGLTKGVNDNARKRNIVFHDSYYAEYDFLIRNQKLGRSKGCFVTSKFYNDLIIDLTNNGTKIFVIGKNE